ncbi:MAG TPA: type II toxin-antitoxin system VapC family toxin [Longimicrobium sp.]
MIVADTNLIGYFIIQGPFTADAEAVFYKDPLWAAPILWRSEMRNVLWKYVRSRQITLAVALKAMEAAEKLLHGKEFQVESQSVLSLADGSGCAAYDCEFVHLAQARGWKLVTADAKLLAQFPGTAVSLQDFVK